MALAIISSLVLGPLALLGTDLLRVVGARRRDQPQPVPLDAGGHRVRAARPNWPAPLATAEAPRRAPSRNRPINRRREYFGDGVLDRTH